MYLLYILIFILGLIIGSFINCLVYRLHEKKTLWGRSFCPQCKHQIAWYDNIPVLSWVFLRGKCRHCKKGISFQYPLVEFATGLLFVIAFYNNTHSLNALYLILDTSQTTAIIRDLAAISFLVVIFLYDLKYYLILDKISLPAILIIFVLNVIIGLNWLNILISGIIGGSFFLVQFLVSRGRWIGDGDIRLGFLMGVLLGWPQILVALFLSYILGSVVAIPLLLSGKKKLKSQLPLGAFLVPGTIAAMFWGQTILDWYIDYLI